MSNPDDRSALSHADFTVGAVTVRPNRLELVIDGRSTRVQPRVMDILVCLAEHAGDAVSREHLRATLWDAHVTDDAIHRAVWKLRQALGDHEALIETVPKRGYRLTAAVTRVGAPPSSEAAPTPTAAGAGTVAAGGSTASPASGSRGRTALTAGGVVVGLILLALVLQARFAGGGDRPVPPADAETTNQPFTAMSGYESSPSVGADGTVVFANFAKDGPRALQWELWARPLGEGEPRRLTTTAEHEINPALSPSGNRVAFARMSDTGCRFLVLEMATGAEHDPGLDCGTRRGPADCCPRVAWNGEQRLLFTRRDDVGAPLRIYEVELQGDGGAMRAGAPRIVTDPPAQSWGDGSPALSPDGDRLAFVRQRSPEIHDLLVLDLASGRVERLTDAGYPIAGLAWSSDGRSLTFGWNRTGALRLWRVAASGGRPQPLATVGMNASGPAVAGDAIVYEEWKSEINLWEVDVAAPTASPLVRSTRWDWRGRRSPDGSRLAFLSNRDGAAEVWIAAGDGSDPRRLTSLGTDVASAPAWSPDGSEVVIAAPSGSSIDVAIIEVASGALSWLVTDASDDRSPIFSGDGKRIDFISDRGGDWDVWSLDRGADAVAQRRTTGGAAAVRTSTDGWLWFVRPGQPGLWRQRLDATASDASQQVSPTFAPSAPEDWGVVAGAVYYTRRDDQYGAWLARLDPATFASTDLVRLEGEGMLAELLSGAGLWVSPDAARVVLSTVDLSHSDLWLRRPSTDGATPR